MPAAPCRPPHAKEGHERSGFDKRGHLFHNPIPSPSPSPKPDPPSQSTQARLVLSRSLSFIFEMRPIVCFFSRSNQNVFDSTKGGDHRLWELGLFDRPHRSVQLRKACTSRDRSKHVGSSFSFWKSKISSVGRIVILDAEGPCLHATRIRLRQYFVCIWCTSTCVDPQTWLLARWRHVCLTQVFKPVSVSLTGFPATGGFSKRL